MLAGFSQRFIAMEQPKAAAAAAEKQKVQSRVGLLLPTISLLGFRGATNH
jgi:hypothetical protein